MWEARASLSRRVNSAAVAESAARYASRLIGIPPVSYSASPLVLEISAPNGRSGKFRLELGVSSRASFCNLVHERRLSPPGVQVRFRCVILEVVRGTGEIEFYE